MVACCQCCSKRLVAIIVVVVGVAIFGLKWKIRNAQGGLFGGIKAFTYEKHGEHGLKTAEDIVKEKGASFKGTVSIVTGVSLLL